MLGFDASWLPLYYVSRVRSHQLLSTEADDRVSCDTDCPSCCLYTTPRQGLSRKVLPLVSALAFADATPSDADLPLAQFPVSYPRRSALPIAHQAAAALTCATRSTSSRCSSSGSSPPRRRCTKPLMAWHSARSGLPSRHGGTAWCSIRWTRLCRSLSICTRESARDSGGLAAPDADTRRPLIFASMRCVQLVRSA